MEDGSVVKHINGSVLTFDTSRPLGNVKASQPIAEITFMEQLGEIGHVMVDPPSPGFQLHLGFAGQDGGQGVEGWLAENTPSPADGENTPWREVIAGRTVQICHLS